MHRSERPQAPQDLEDPAVSFTSAEATPELQPCLPPGVPVITPVPCVTLGGCTVGSPERAAKAATAAVPLPWISVGSCSITHALLVLQWVHWHTVYLQEQALAAAPTGQPLNHPTGTPSQGREGQTLLWGDTAPNNQTDQAKSNTAAFPRLQRRGKTTTA